MGFNEFMAKVRQLDNKMAKWMLRHFYILFFEAFLVFIFLLLFVNTLHVIDAFSLVNRSDAIQRLLFSQSVNQLLIVLLLILNSFWMLFVFNAIIRIRSLLRDISFTLSKRRSAISTH